jgi:phage terminase large subunit GpA-like protein
MWSPKRETPDQWGRCRIYGPGTGVPGPRNPNLTPYAIEFGRAFTHARYKRVVLVMAAQTGKTDTLLDVIGERLDNRPAPVLYVGPNKQFITDQFEPRVRQLFEQSKSLQSKMLGGINGKRQKQTLKRVNGTTFRLAHAGSSTALKSDQASLAVVDEYDELLANVKGQGDPLGLIEARGFTYADFVAGVVSTPSCGMIKTEIDEVSGLEFWAAVPPEDIDAIQSPIWRLWQEGTRHHWCWPCPHCDDYFVPRFSLMRFPKGATPLQARREAFIECPHCHGVIEENHKPDMNARGRHVAPGQSISRDGVVTGEPPESSTLSFWVSGFASPFVTIGARAEAYVRALRTNLAEKIQTEINAQFGELYVDGSGDVPPWEQIYERRLGYLPGTVPEDARYLTCGIDVGKRRVHFVVRGWGAFATSWLIKHGEMLGETAEPEIWERLDDFLATPIDGRLIKLCFVDSGFRPGKREGVPVNRVYEFCRRHRSFVFPSKGSSHAMLRPIVRAKIEVNQQGEAAKFGLELMRLDSDHWKSFVHERLRWPADQPGAWHLHNLVDEDYCRGLVSEVRVMGVNGKPQWLVRSRENHYLDAEALAAAAGYQLNVQHLRGGKRRSPPVATAEQPEEPVAPTSDAIRTEPPAPRLIPAHAIPPKRDRLAELARRLNR